jgi:hypothetical protein
MCEVAVSEIGSPRPRSWAARDNASIERATWRAKIKATQSPKNKRNKPPPPTIASERYKMAFTSELGTVTATYQSDRCERLMAPYERWPPFCDAIYELFRRLIIDLFEQTPDGFSNATSRVVSYGDVFFFLSNNVPSHSRGNFCLVQYFRENPGLDRCRENIDDGLFTHDWNMDVDAALA